ncbi:MAG: hypothetical protein ACE5PO_08450 [Candidatus Bathyarchaeia archaeon]
MNTEIRIIPRGYDSSAVAEIEKILRARDINTQRLDYGPAHRAVLIDDAPDVDTLMEALDDVCRSVAVEEILIVTPRGFILKTKP